MKEEEKSVKGKKYNIEVKCFLPESNQNVQEVILACHGFGGDKESSAIKLVAEEFVKKNIAVIAFDFPGHGASRVEANELTIDNCIEDIKCVEKYIHKDFGDIPINIFATSFGAYIMLIKLSREENQYKNIILRAPAIKMADILEHSLLREDMHDYKRRGYTILGFERKMKIPFSFYEELQEYDIFRLYHNDEKIIHIIQGNQDDIAPIQDTQKFVEKYKPNIKLDIIEGANHRMKGPGEMDKMIEYCRKILL